METLDLLKVRLGISTDARDSYLQAIVEGIQSELLNRQGVLLDTSKPDDLMFLVDYATWRYSNVGETSGMPRHLQYRLHNIIISKER